MQCTSLLFVSGVLHGIWAKFTMRPFSFYFSTFVYSTVSEPSKPGCQAFRSFASFSGICLSVALSVTEAGLHKTFYLQDLLKEACKSFIAPLALTMKTAPFNTQQVKDGVETFFSQWCRPMGLLLQVIYDYFMFYDRSSGRWLLLHTV